MTTEYRPYTQKYGDVDNVPKDVKALNDIINRQGMSLIVDVLAEYIGECQKRWKLNSQDLNRMKFNLTEELIQAINERT